MICFVGDILGMAVIDNKVFIVFHNSSNIKVYDAVTFKQVSVITVEGLKDPHDIVVCHHDRQLYVADRECCIWRVSVDDHSYVKWLMTDDTLTVDTLSVTSRRILVTSSRPPILRQYNTVDSQLLSVIKLPQYAWSAYHAVETTCGTFVVSHRGTSQDKWQWAVSKLLS